MPPICFISPPEGSAWHYSTTSTVVYFLYSEIGTYFGPLQLTMPVLCVLVIAVTLEQKSVFTTLVTGLPLPRVPVAPVEFQSAGKHMPEGSATTLGSSTWASNEATLHNSPSLPPRGRESVRDIAGPHSTVLITWEFTLYSLATPVKYPAVVTKCLSPSFVFLNEGEFPTAFVLC